MLQRITVKRLNRYSKNKQIWCMGCGKRLYEILDIYKEEAFLDRITVLIDNNERLWGVNKQVANKTITICGVDKFQEISNEKVIVLITSDHYKNIYESIENTIKQKKIACFIYPKYYASFTPFVMACIKILPLKRQLLFYAGNEPHENADEVVKYLEEDYKGEKYKVFYLNDGDDRSNHDNRTINYLNKWTVRKKSSLKDILSYAYGFGCSKFLFYENEPIEKVRKNQRLIFLNHGTIPLKKVRDVLQQPEEVDYATCPGLGCSELYESQYGINRKKQIYMMPPRVNHMLKCNGGMHKLIGVTKQQIIFWLPTFRQLAGSNRRDSDETNPIAIVTSNIEKFNAILRDNDQVLVIKKHPREKENINIPSHCNNIRIIHDEELFKNNISLQELLKDTDALLTDYSGIAFEFMLFDRPIGYVVSDMDNYFRGFAVDNPTNYMPGMKIRDIKEMQTFLETVKNKDDNYSVKRKKLIDRLFGVNAYENGAKKLIEFLDGDN